MVRPLFYFFIPLFLISCSADKRAMKAFRDGRYQKVLDYYMSAIESKNNKKIDKDKANYYIAESYRLSNRIKEAEPFYEKALNYEEKSDLAPLYYAQSLKANGKYEEAKTWLASFQTKGDKNPNVQRELEALRYIEKIDQRKNYYDVTNLNVLNSPFSEYSPVYLNGELYFTSNRDVNKIYEATGTPYTKLYKVDSKGAKVEIKTLSSLSEKINSASVNQGCVTFSPNGKVMIFAKGNTGKFQDSPDVDLYMSRFIKGKWSTPKRLNINRPDSWESTPTFSPDGRRIYFSSNRKGGYGGLDLYSARMQSRGRFAKPKNLGSTINTSGNELFPHMSQTGNFYFSSDGHPGYGMLDLFEVSRKDGKREINNMGRPMNSTSDDFAIFLFKSDRGFFTSNRKEGRGDDDIYTFVNRDPDLKIVNYFLEGITKTIRESDSAMTILSNVDVTLMNDREEILEEFVTGNDGRFFFRVYENEDYILMGKEDGYLVKREPYTTRGKSVSRDSLEKKVTNITLDTVLVLDKLKKDKIFVLKNIYFDFDKYDIRADAAPELDRLVLLLNDNPEIRIEMGSHTDSKASNEYNIELSQKRAEATVSYLVSQGVSSNRLSAKGYGEEVPIASNTNPDGSDNPEGRQLNRRTEFKIIDIIESSTEDKKSEEERKKDFDEDQYFEDE